MRSDVSVRPVQPIKSKNDKITAYFNHIIFSRYLNNITSDIKRSIRITTGVSFIPSRGWAEMIKKVYETDSLICPKCGGKMHVISFIQDYKVIDKIINHLKSFPKHL